MKKEDIKQFFGDKIFELAGDVRDLLFDFVEIGFHMVDLFLDIVVCWKGVVSLKIKIKAWLDKHRK